MGGIPGAVVLCFMATLLSAAESEHIILGRPVGGYTINHVGYCCGYKAKVGCSAWVAYHLKPDYFGKEPALKGAQHLYIDPAVAASGLKTPASDDLKDPGLLPLFFFSRDNALGRSPECEKEVFSLVNVAAAKGGEPMLEVWRKLDAATRQWAQDFKEVWVIAGPIFPAEPERTASRKMAIPQSFYKIVAKKEGDTIKTIAFIVPQDASGKLSGYITTIAEIEKVTDLDFFPALPRDQKKIVKTAVPVMWELAPSTIVESPVKSAGLPTGVRDRISEPLPNTGKSAPASGGSGKVWVLGERYYSSGSTRYGKGGGTFMTEEEATLLGFTAAR